MTRALTKTKRLQRLKLVLLQAPNGIGLMDLLEVMDVARQTLHRDLYEIGACPIHRGWYTYVPTEQDIAFASAVANRVGARVRIGITPLEELHPEFRNSDEKG